jgi:hypothetical protein
MAGQAKRRKLMDPELLLHTGGISTAGLAKIMKIIKSSRLMPEELPGKSYLRDGNSVRSAVMFEQQRHFGINVFK